MYVPVDIRLADQISWGKISAYMTTKKLCQQGEPFDNPIPWYGFFSIFVKGVKDYDVAANPRLKDAMAGRYVNDQIAMENCGC